MSYATNELYNGEARLPFSAMKRAEVVKMKMFEFFGL